MTPAQSELIFGLRVKLQAAPHAERGKLVADIAKLMGRSVQTIYRKLEKVGWASSRKPRTDKGRLCVDEDLARLASGMVKTATRANGKKTLPLTVTCEILQGNGMGVDDAATGERRMPSPGTMARAMRRYGCHPAQLAQGHPAQQLRSLHPNHVGQVDASVCTIFYLPKGKVEVMAEEKFYKNKQSNLDKAARDRVIRFVYTDHYSGALYARYCLGAEDAANTIDFLISAMVKREGQPFHGVPKILMMDKGPGNTSALMKNFLRRLDVQPLPHAKGNPRAKGQVEKAQDIVECHFEGRLRMLDIRCLEDLNRELTDWLVKFNAHNIHTRHGMARNPRWLTIKEDQLRVPQSEDMLRELVGNERICKVRGDMLLRHSIKGYGPQVYDLRILEDLVIGQEITVTANPFRAPEVDVLVTAPDGEQTIYHLKPICYNEAGFDVDASVIGAEIRAVADTVTDKALKAISKEAYGVDTLEAAAKAKDKNLQAYAQIDAMADVKAAKDILYLPKKGRDLGLDAARRGLTPLDHVEAIRGLQPLLAIRGLEWAGAAHLQWLKANYPQTVPQEDLAAIADALADLSAGAARDSVRSGMRLVVGG